MSEMLKRKIEEQNKLHNRMQELVQRASEEDRDFTAEERTEWDDRLEPRISEVSKDIERLERAAKLENIDYRQVLQGQGEDKPGTPETSEVSREALREEAFGAYLRGGMGSLTPEQRAVMVEHRASPQGVGVPADGGYLVPPGYRAIMTETLKEFGGLMQLANVITTSTGNPLQWPTNDDTGSVGAILNEHSAIAEAGVTIGTKTVGAFMYTSKLVRVSLQLLQDSAFDLDTWLPRKLGERIGRAVADDLVNGTGTTEPFGILPTAVSGTTTALTAANFMSGGGGAGAHLGYDAIINLEHSVDPAYRARGNCRFLLSDQALKILRKYKDQDGRPLWQPVPVPGMPATINGQPYTIDQAMPSGTTGAGDFAATHRPVLFGDFRAGLLVRQALDVQAVRLAERYAEMLQVGFFGFMRLDAVPDDAAAVRALVLT
jgi:HK97 family phage major capsid protein